ncbi:MAG: HAD hydrolase family protein [Gemmataceae bacterium]|nr:HAD hydrolase family protein [Gemmata sp.]MDW8195992.1 HAD hydrolase family protein [Gemmataceae bacterium]
MKQPTITERVQAVALLVLDVDGVLTDGSIVYLDDGREMKRFHVRDGSGLKLWHTAGKQTAVISGRHSPAVSRRAEELGIQRVIQGCDDKRAGLAEILSALRLTPQQVAVIGDDLADVPLFRDCGVAIAVADACPEARASADYVTLTRGGQGAVREAIEWLLQQQGLWDQLIARYTQTAHGEPNRC